MVVETCGEERRALDAFTWATVTMMATGLDLRLEWVGKVAKEGKKNADDDQWGKRGDEVVI